MLIVLLAGLALQAATPAEAEPPRDDKTVIVAPDPTTESAPPMNSRIERDAPEVYASDALAAMVLREWANCVVRTRRRDALALLATRHNSAAQTEVIEKLTTARFGWRSLCARARMMEVDNIVMRGALAEALHRWERRRGRSAGPLEPPSAPASPDAPDRALLLAVRCVIQAEPGAVADLMEVRPDSARSTKAVLKLAPKLNHCLPARYQAADYHPLLIRGALGEPFYLSSRRPPGTNARRR